MSYHEADKVKYKGYQNRLKIGHEAQPTLNSDALLLKQMPKKTQNGFVLLIYRNKPGLLFLNEN